MPRAPVHHSWQCFVGGAAGNFFGSWRGDRWCGGLSDGGGVERCEAQLVVIRRAPGFFVGALTGVGFSLTSGNGARPIALSPASDFSAGADAATVGAGLAGGVSKRASPSPLSSLVAAGLVALAAELLDAAPFAVAEFLAEDPRGGRGRDCCHRRPQAPWARAMRLQASQSASSTKNCRRPGPGRARWLAHRRNPLPAAKGPCRRQIRWPEP